VNIEAGRPQPTVEQIIRADQGSVPAVLAARPGSQMDTADIPFARYISKEFFDLEMSRMWRRVWQFACREEHLPEPGDYYVYDIGRHSIVLVRTESGTIKGYHNSCLHRGTKLKPSDSSGYSPNLQCPYHGWTWTLDGILNEVPCAWEFPHLDYEKNRLPEVRVDVWNTLVFINMDKDAPPLRDYLEVLPDHFRNWRFDGWYTSVHARKALPCNWKAAQDAFIEAYHTEMVHPQCVATAGDINAQHDIFGDHVSRDIVPLGVSSPRMAVPLSEQEILDQMLMGDRSIVDGSGPTVPDGETARSVMARQLRETFAGEFGLDLSGLSTAEMIDSIKYTLFPNLFIFAGISLRVLYVYRPLGMDPDRCLFDILFMRPVPKDGPRPDPAQMVWVGEDESYCDVPGMDPGFGQLFDQDTNILRLQRDGMHASEKGAATFSTYLESRLRHIHGTLDKYIDGRK
jgi:nitrite reductase/ring-hydroxylating ferredoxin subunit